MFIIQDMLQTQIIDKYKYISKIMVNNYNYDIKIVCTTIIFMTYA